MRTEIAKDVKECFHLCRMLVGSSLTITQDEHVVHASMLEVFKSARLAVLASPITSPVGNVIML